MDEQIAQLDRRLTSVEIEVASLAAEVSATRSQFASREDFARLDGRLAVIQSNYVTKEDLAAVENKLSGEIAALRLQMAELEKHMMRWSLATIVAISSVVLGVVKIWP